jgi:hypothetical protein
MCQNTKNMKITPVTDICSKDDFVKEKVLTPHHYHWSISLPLYCAGWF